jgi:NAD(P)-dependent dehydrogenase (short-subunit alcohol dehydrogenase family)
LTGRVVIVTGATSGLGRAMAFALLDAGHCVVGTGRDEARLSRFIVESEARAGTARVLGISANVRSPDDCALVVAATLRRFARIDAVVNNAGVHQPATGNRPKFYEIANDDWTAIVDTHLNGAFHMARAVVPHLLAAGWGRIVNHETSYETMLRPGFTPYGAAKAGVEVATAGWAAELHGTGVTVNAILPGGVADVPRISADAYPDRSRLVPPERMGPPVCWLMSEASDDITGRRVTARRWDPLATDAENVERAVSPVGFTPPGDTPVHRVADDPA